MSTVYALIRVVVLVCVGHDCIGMTWEEAHRRCPEGVVPACHNSLDNVTVSGPAEAVTSFVTELQNEGVFAKSVNSGGVAFHSSHMTLASSAVKQRLQQVSVSCTPTVYDQFSLVQFSNSTVYFTQVL